MRASRWVVAAAAACAFIGGGPFASLASAATAPPSIDSTSMVNGGKPCATSAPLPTVGGLGNVLEAARTDTGNNYPVYTFTFEVWPTSDPAAVTDVSANTYASRLLASANVPTTALTSGTTYSWHVNVSDGTTTSPWSTTCSFQYDVTPPPAPTVTSNYPQNQWGPLGEMATFTFDGHGNPDVGGYLYSWGRELPIGGCTWSGPLGQLSCPDPLARPDVVRPSIPGGTASVTLNPPGPGPQTLTVASMDVAGNVSQPPMYYQIMAPWSGPTITVMGPQAICSNRIRVTFAPYPGLTGIVSYAYQLDGGKTTTVHANANGTATAVIPVTSQNSMLTATSTSRNGFTSSNGYDILDVNPQPSIQADVYLNDGQPAGGIGTPGTFTLSPPWDGNWVGSYSYRFSDGEPATVAAAPDDTATIHWTPKRSGTETLTVTANNADGSGSSCAMQYSFNVAATAK